MLDPTSDLGKGGILSTAVRPKKEKKGLLDKYLINGPPTIGIANNTIIWRPGQENLADYQNKHHPGAHHSAVRPFTSMRKIPPWYYHGR